MRLWRLLELICTLLVVPGLYALGVLTWIVAFGGQARFAWPATALFIGTVGLFMVLQTMSNELRDKELREAARRARIERMDRHRDA